MPSEQQINTIAQKMGSVLIDAGVKMMKSAFHIDPKVIEYTDFTNLIKLKFPKTDLTLLDGKYYAIPFWQWQQLIESDWIHLKQWILDKFDCDNFSYSFSSYASQVFEINTAGAVYGIVYDKYTGQLVAYHYFNMIITKEADNTNKFYFYEPGNNKYIEYNGGDIIIGNWRYEPLRFIFF